MLAKGKKVMKTITSLYFLCIEDKCVDPDLNRCENGATCQPIENDLACACAPGYTSTYCEVQINECDVKPCVHGTCADAVNDYSCNCDSGILCIIVILRFAID